MAPRGINRPGYPSASSAKRGAFARSPVTPSSAKRGVFAASPRTPTNINRPGRNDNDRGPNIVVKPKPPVPKIKQPPTQSVFAPTTSSQARKQYFDQLGGGVVPLSDIQNITQKYKRAADIPGYIAKQKDYQTFSQYAGEGPAPRFTQGPLEGQQILSMREPQLTAMAPTFGQFMGDIGRGFGNIIGAGTEFITGGGMLGNIFKGIGGFFKPGEPGTGTTAPVPLFQPSRGGNDQGPMMNTQVQEYQNLNATQQDIYNMLIKQGLSHAAALAQAVMQKPATNPYLDMINRLRGDNTTTMASGGIATLN